MNRRTIPVRVRLSDGKFRQVRGWNTRSEHFAVTRRIGSKTFIPEGAPLFTVTHIPTGGSLFPAYSLREGKLIAAIAGALPVKWGKLTTDNFAQMYQGLDPIWAKWAHELQFPKKKARAA